ncbi:maleylacetoacetate isomerase [Limimaricola sp.]|uniref:maleylacetoacetate isomerase n=1 Tax=Limimaricola sp. TaxID=2211665 RepID=UPI004059C5AE
MQAEIRLYDHWRSSASYRVRIALNLAGLDYLRVPVDLVAGAQRAPAHLARNPQGLVPVLEIDGLRLTQSMAIIDYLEDTGRLSLRPADPGRAARMRAVMQAIACDIHPVCNLRVADHALAPLAPGPDGAEASRAEWMRHFIRPGLEAVEALLAAEPGPFSMGGTPTQADLVVVPQLYNADRWGVETGGLARLREVGAACAGLPAFHAAHPDRLRPG